MIFFFLNFECIFNSKGYYLIKTLPILDPRRIYDLMYLSNVQGFAFIIECDVVQGVVNVIFVSLFVAPLFHFAFYH